MPGSYSEFLLNLLFGSHVATERRFIGQESSSSSSQAPTRSSSVGATADSHLAPFSPTTSSARPNKSVHRRMPSREELDESIVQTERYLSVNEPSKALAIVEKILSGPCIDASSAFGAPRTYSHSSLAARASSSSSSASSSSCWTRPSSSTVSATTAEEDPAFPASVVPSLTVTPVSASASSSLTEPKKVKSASGSSGSSSSGASQGGGGHTAPQPTLLLPLSHNKPNCQASPSSSSASTSGSAAPFSSRLFDAARLLRCKALVQLGEWARALSACQHALAHTPDNHELLYLCGKCLIEMKSFTEAVALFGLAIDAKSDHLPSWLARGLTYHHHLKDPARAVSDFHASIVLNPTYYKAFFYMGMAMTDLQRHELAVEAYCRSIHLNASYSESYFRRGVIHLQHQRLELAIEDFAKVSELVPYSAEAHYNRALAQHLLKRNEDAIASYNCCLQYQPTYVNALKNCALAQSELGLYTEAFENYSTALVDCKLDDTTKLDILMSRGQVCERSHDLDQALADYTEAIQLNPSFGRAHTCRGLLHIQRHDLTSALADLSSALLLEPENARAWNNRGTAYLQLNQLDLALADFEQSISLCPTFVKALRNRGKVFYLQQDLPSALHSLTTAIQQPTSNGDPECFLLRGSVHHALGHSFKALKDYSRAPEPARKRNWRVEQSELLEWAVSP